eukprot:464831-Amphidinium_carterae.1
MALKVYVCSPSEYATYVYDVGIVLFKYSQRLIARCVLFLRFMIWFYMLLGSAFIWQTFGLQRSFVQKPTERHHAVEFYI